MKNLLFYFVILFLSILQLAQAQPVPDKDTAWTKDLWPETITGAKFTPDGSKIVVTTNDKIRVYDTETGEVLKYYDVSDITTTIFCMDLHPGGNYLVTGDHFKILIWNLETGDTLKSLNIIPTHIKYCADGNEILINYIYDNVNAYSELIKWNLITGDTVIKVFQATISAMSISKNGINFAIGIGRPYRYLHLWDYTNMIDLANLGYHENRIQDIDFSPDGKYIASAGYDGYIKIWDIENRNLYKSFIHDSGYHYVETIKFSPDSKFIVSGINAGENTKIWNIETNNMIKKYNYSAIKNLDIDINKKFILATSSYFINLLNGYWVPNDVIEKQQVDTVILYPNPSTGIITIQYKQPISEITNIFISGLNGQIVKPLFNNFIEEGNKKIDFSTHDVLNGSYIVKVENTHLSLTFKLIINK